MENYREAFAKLCPRERRKIGNNTYLEARGARTIAVRLHATDILIFHRDGRVVFETGGWKTVTTKARMNEWAPRGFRVYSNRGVWYLYRTDAPYDAREEWPFADGITIRGRRVFKVGKPPERTMKERARVAKFAKGFLDALVAGKVPAPGAGDCFYCQLADGKGVTMGEHAKDHGRGSHLRAHMAERYYVPSLLRRALEARGASQSMWWFVGACGWDGSNPELAAKIKERDEGFERGRVEKILRTYVMQQLGMAV